jgi:hypothetical protein
MVHLYKQQKGSKLNAVFCMTTREVTMVTVTIAKVVLRYNLVTKESDSCGIEG